MKWSLIFILPFLLIPIFAKAQHIQGQIIDAKTEKPIPFASVYFNHTTHGTGADENGRFQIKADTASTSLIFQAVGYRPKAVDVNCKEDTIINVSLSVNIRTLDAVTVIGEKKRLSRQYLSTFKNDFIGNPKNKLVRKCELLNPEALSFEFDQETQTLRAFADSTLHIRNHALGYDMDIKLTSFERAGVGQSAQYLFKYYSKFREIEWKAKSKKRSQALLEREKVYYGSSMHFFRALGSGTAEKEGFSVYRAQLVPNPNRPPDSILLHQTREVDQEIRRLRTQDGVRLKLLQAQNKKNNLLRKSAWPKVLVKAEKQPFSSASLLSDFQELRFTGYIVVHYVSPFSEIEKYAMITIPSGKSLLLLESGHLIGADLLEVNGDWAHMKAATFLPFDYTPPFFSELTP
ncbi:hypothetical protein FUAX_01560 [Fulvitalea axinellae]|uniref:Carboxypeptidase-like regulatory domain-containing protein n=1 Tax=Fulvitalea axinellae TaxID=1182444 RepID=A0AAU9C6V4_9BACT|nr:hypothetical protein FUAX_01560 [Fulvitalea axinellae]